MVISNLLDNIRLLFVREKKPFLRLRAILGFYPHDIRPYRQALMHKSLAYYEHERIKAAQGEDADAAQQKGASAKKRRRMGKNAPSVQQPPSAAPVSSKFSINNERLEFLGDAVLGAIVADILYKHYGKKQEGFLTTLRSKMVCRNTLNRVAKELGLDQLIHYAGAATTGHNSFMGGNAFEAFVGAIYVDRGYSYCYRFLNERVFHQLIDIEQVEKQEQNFKSKVTEWCQKYQYKFAFVQKESRSPENSNVPVFHSTVFIEGIPCGTGDGYSKKESDQEASKQTMKRIHKDKDLRRGIAKAAAHRHS